MIDKIDRNIDRYLFLFYSFGRMSCDVDWRFRGGGTSNITTPLKKLLISITRSMLCKWASRSTPRWTVYREPEVLHTVGVEQAERAPHEVPRT